MATESVIIEFISDTSQLQPAVDQLEKMGQVEKSTADQFRATNKTVQDQGRVMKLTADEFRKSGLTLEQLAAKVKKSGTETQTLVNIEKSLKTELGKVSSEVKKSAEELSKQDKVLKDNTTSSLALRSQLRQMIEQLSQMKVQGKDNTEQYRLLAQQAGNLKDAIGDANQEVKNFGSDTSTLDGVISLAGGVAGGFAAIQGAAALFGDESEELQKTLLRVNAAMAILQGLQQLQTVLQKESAAATLLNTIATRAQTLAQTAYNFVVGSSIGLTKAFRIALAATGVGLLVIGIIELISALKSQNNELENANTLLEHEKNVIESLNTVIEQRVSIEEARARAAGAAESQLIAIQGRGLQAQRAGLVESNRIFAEEMALLETGNEAWVKLNNQIFANNEAIKGLDTQIIVKSLDLEKQLADERAEALKKRIDAAKKEAEEAKQRAKERRAAEFADFEAGIKVRLLAAKEGSEEELQIRKELLRATLQVELDNEKLTTNQRRLLIQQFFRDRIEAEKKFAKDREQFILEQIASDIQAELQGLEVSQERRLDLTETAINLAAELEINAAAGNGAKIAEINAKRDKAIRDARIASIQDVVNYEIALATATSGPAQRRLQAEVANDKLSLKQRISAIDQLTQIDSSAIQKRIAALNEERKAKLISEKDYKLQYAQLTDEQLKIWEDAEKKKTDITTEESAKRREKTIADIQLIIEVANQVVGLLDSLFQLQSAKENNDLAERKDRLKELQEAGAITEKEAITRQKRIEAEEKRIRREQAQRDKQIAVFNAFLAVPVSILKGLSQGGPILAAVYGAIALAQAIIVSSRPLPKFGKGKKNQYQGLAEVGETGAELIQSNGRMYVADKPQVVWLGKNDKVFNPQETIDMMSKGSLNTERVMIPAAKSNGQAFNYEKLGKTIAKHVSTNVFVDGVQEQRIKEKEFTHWLTKRRSW